MQLINLAVGAFEQNKRDEGTFVDSIAIAAGQRAVEVRCIHMLPVDRPPGRIEQGVLGELPNGHDHLLIMLGGLGRISGGTTVRAPIKAGQAAYFPKEEGYLIFADTPLTGILLKSGDLVLSVRALRAAA